MNPYTEINLIDRRIKAVHSELRGLEKINPISAASWQAAWDKHPDLHAREIELYRQRGETQVERAAKEHKQWQVESRRQGRMKKCPTCHQRTLKAA